MITSTKRYARLFWSIIPRWAVPYTDPCADPHDEVVIDGIFIDAAIAPLVVRCWGLGIATYSSCQGDPFLYRLYRSRHWVLHSPAANPYSAHLSVAGVDAARIVARFLNPVSDREVTLSKDPCNPAWFVYFDPRLLAGTGQPTLDADPPTTALEPGGAIEMIMTTSTLTPLPLPDSVSVQRAAGRKIGTSPTRRAT